MSETRRCLGCASTAGCARKKLTWTLVTRTFTAPSALTPALFKSGSDVQSVGDRSRRRCPPSRRAGRRSPGTPSRRRCWGSSGWSDCPGHPCGLKHTSCGFGKTDQGSHSEGYRHGRTWQAKKTGRKWETGQMRGDSEGSPGSGTGEEKGRHRTCRDHFETVREVQPQLHQTHINWETTGSATGSGEPHPASPTPRL